MKITSKIGPPSPPKPKKFPTLFPFLVENKRVGMVVFALAEGETTKYGRLVQGVVVQSSGNHKVGYFAKNWILEDCVMFEGKIVLELENG
jgi:hypothetical protein